MRYAFLCMTYIPAVILLAGCNLGHRIPVEMTTMEQSRALEAETSLKADISMDIGSLEISGGSAPDLYSVNLEYDRACYTPEIDYRSGAEGRLVFKLERSHKGGIRSEGNHNRVRLSLADSLPLNLQVNTGVGDARLALSNLRLTQLSLEAGVGGAKISAYEPNPVICDQIRLRNGVGGLDAVGLGNLNFRRFDYEGGVGGADLDFSGEWKQDAQITIQVGVGGVSLRLPREVGARVTAEKHFLSGLQLDGFRKDSSEDYYSNNYEDTKIRVTIVVKTGIGGFRISWI